MKVPKEFFENKRQQNEIKTELLKAIPEGVHYYNLILALADLLQWAVQEEYKESAYAEKVEDDD